MNTRFVQTIALASLSPLFLAIASARPVAPKAQTVQPERLYAEGHDDVDAYDQSYVTTSAVVRAAPSSRARIVNRLARGQFVNLGKCQGTWCYVDVQGGNGWVAGRLIGRGKNPYDRYAPAGRGIPRQEPGTRHDRNAQPID